MGLFKLRAWDKLNKEMWMEITPSSNYFYIGNEHCSITDFSEGHIEENVSFMISSGVKDSKGVEVYEGDIVQLSEGHIVEIIFQDGGLGWNGLWDGDFIGLAGHRYLTELKGRMKVIGNKYQNPELLSA
jgi:hypothetical protein